ncbi:hypothetical protein AVEN_100773-1 [Araneus ventricosus]|uniref:Reverse transcriptase/retrotransposon-derived protein RNase H-like domain-containing protein n=1 Tax=Araneus ventricosus TaxID=182803 RepID=A0A4Y2AXQ0_ARAVE|nr:hypothetical protein AVEN_100773-1 [Araneus ventricosus]
MCRENVVHLNIPPRIQSFKKTDMKIGNEMGERTLPFGNPLLGSLLLESEPNLKSALNFGISMVEMDSLDYFLTFGTFRLFQDSVVREKIARHRYIHTFVDVRVLIVRVIDSVAGLSTKGELTNAHHSEIKLVSDNMIYKELFKDYPELLKPIPNFKKAISHDTVHFIETTGPPLFSKPRRLHPKVLNEVKKEFQYLIDQGISRPSKSPWASPIHTVPKADGSYRVCDENINDAADALSLITAIKFPTSLDYAELSAEQKADFKDILEDQESHLDLKLPTMPETTTEIYYDISIGKAIPILAKDFRKQSNGLVEDWHRPLKCAFKALRTEKWTEVLSTILLGFRAAIKTDSNVPPT